MAAFAIWGGSKKSVCSGRYVRGVCVFGPGDLQTIVSRKEMFANKFNSRYKPISLNCLEEWIFNRTYNPPGIFDTHFYRQLPFIPK